MSRCGTRQRFTVAGLPDWSSILFAMLRVREHVTLKDFTTLKVGGTARYFFSVSTAETLAEAVLFARGKKLPLVVLGGGSNVIVSDTLIDALVVKIEIQGIEWVEDVLKCRDFDILKSQHLNMSESQNSNISTSQNVLVVAGAGESWDALVGEAVKRGLWGIENLSGIPGTVGAAPIQNIGAYGAEIQNVLEWVEVFDAKTGKIRTLPNHECFFGYRDSIFKTPRGRDLIITRVALRLSKNGTPHLEYKDLKERFKNKDSGFKNPTVQEIRQAVLEIRIRKFPNLRQFGTAGSFFKNPIIPKRQFDELKKKYPDLVGY